MAIETVRRDAAGSQSVGLRPLLPTTATEHINVLAHYHRAEVAHASVHQARRVEAALVAAHRAVAPARARAELRLRKMPEVGFKSPLSPSRSFLPVLFDNPFEGKINNDG